MRAVVQRVDRAEVSADGRVSGSIGRGILVYLGVHSGDTEKDLEYTVDKAVNLRIFEDDKGKMNLSLADIKGDILLISQFTLYGDTRKGRRPSYNEAALADKGKEYYQKASELMKKKGFKTETGVFGAKMKVDYINNGPVTILIDSFKYF